MTAKKPWGEQKTLCEDSNYRVKHVQINPESRQSYRSNKIRKKSWVILSGEGKIIINDEETKIGSGGIVLIPAEYKHRIENTSKTEPLVFVETQFGDVNINDVTRYEDDYGRHLDNWSNCDGDLL